jgi:hypothetical protein
VTRLSRVVVAAAILIACTLPRGESENGIQVFPLTFETNLLTARECADLGSAESASEAKSKGANAVVLFVDAGRSWRGKAVQCPDSVLQRLIASSTDGAQR